MVLEDLNGHCSVFLVCGLYIVYISDKFDGGEFRTSTAVCGDETSEAHSKVEMLFRDWLQIFSQRA